MTLQLCNDSYFFRAEEHLKELQLVRQKKKKRRNRRDKKFQCLNYLIILNTPKLVLPFILESL